MKVIVKIRFSIVNFLPLAIIAIKCSVKFITCNKEYVRISLVS